MFIYNWLTDTMLRVVYLRMTWLSKYVMYYFLGHRKIGIFSSLLCEISNKSGKKLIVVPTFYKVNVKKRSWHC